MQVGKLLTAEEYINKLRLKELVSEYLCIRGYTLKEILGQGTYGCIFNACKPKNNCEYVMKIVNLKGQTNKSDFIKEVKYTKMFDYMGPKFYGAWMCRNKGFIVTEKYTMSMKQYLLKYNKIPKNIIMKLVDYINSIHEKGIIHGDLSLNNIMVKLKKNKIEKIGIIDWGFAFKKGEEDLITLYNLQQYFISWYGDNFPFSLKELEEHPKKLDYGVLYYLYQYRED